MAVSWAEILMTTGCVHKRRRRAAMGETDWTRTFLGVLLAAALAGCSAQQPAQSSDAGTVTIDSNVTLLQSPDAAGPVRLAILDLAGDLAKVFGQAPRIVKRLEEAGPVTIIVGENTQIPVPMRASGSDEPESFTISVVETPAGGHAVALTGPDMRGAIYAAYQFAEDYLGVDPMYYWTDHEPGRRKQIDIPTSTSRIFPGPLFKYRGFFINDEDLLTGWAPGEKDGASISLEVMDKIYETILRLKGNMIVPGTWIFPDDPQVKRAGERGLIVTQHHAMAVGMNVARWPANTPYNYSTHPEILENAWRNAVNTYTPGQEVLWSVGLRGLSDTSYATLDSSVVNDDTRFGMLVSKAIETQMRIVREVYPEAKFVTSFWREGAQLARDGKITIPKEVGRVWGDRGFGLIMDGGNVSEGDGIYYHVAMLNGHANQLTEMVPIDRIYAELGRFIEAGATNYLLLNTSDIRPVAMTAETVMDAAWGGLPEGNAAGRYRAWAGRQFGAKAADDVGSVLEEYFRAFSRVPEGEPQAGDDYGDNAFHRKAQDLLMQTMVDPPYFYLLDQAPKWTPVLIVGLDENAVGVPLTTEEIERELKITGEAQEGWDSVWRHANDANSKVARDRRDYYQAYVLLMIAINQESNRILNLVAQAVLDYRSGDIEAARANMLDTLKSFDKIEAMQRKAEYGKWKNWYRGEWLIDMRRTRERVEFFLRYLDDPMTLLPMPIVNSWQAYYHILHYQGYRSVDVSPH
jgi:hypothetical protein